VRQSEEICSYQSQRKATKIVYSNSNIWNSCCQQTEGYTKSKTGKEEITTPRETRNQNKLNKISKEDGLGCVLNIYHGENWC